MHKLLNAFPPFGAAASFLCVSAGLVLSLPAQARAQTLSGERVKVCSVFFTEDPKRPARVPDSAFACFSKATHELSNAPADILVLIGAADRKKEMVTTNGKSREDEDMTGEDLRFWDIAAYRSVNTKAYLVQWQKIPANRIAARTAYFDAQSVDIYLEKADADLKKMFPDTVPIFEDPCTMKPCPKPDEEDLHPQHRNMIPQPVKK
jgi:hypothetical protein